MNKLEKSLQLVRNHFKETPAETLRQEFDKFYNPTSEDITIEEYFASFENNHSFLSELVELDKYFESDIIFSEWEEITDSPVKISEKLTLDWATQVVSSNKNEFTEELYKLKAA